MATALIDDTSGRGTATCRYFGEGSALAEGDTIGITVESDTNLQTVPAGGQTLYEAAVALANLVRADGYDAQVSKNADADVCLHVQGAAFASVVLTLPVFVVA